VGSVRHRFSLPFDGVEFEPRQSMKYRSNFNVLDLIKLANKELRPSDPPVCMIASNCEKQAVRFEINHLSNPKDAFAE
jgi:hypothetical protein